MIVLENDVIIPKEFASLAGKTENELKLELAIFFYKAFKISSGKAARFAGIPRVVFYRELGNHKVPVNYDVADFEQDLKTLEKLNFNPL